MKRPKQIKSNKKLRDRPNMTFIERVLFPSLREIHDSYVHTVANIVLIRVTRVTVREDGTHENYVRWICPTLGRGYADINYWVTAARKRHKPER